MTSRPMQSTKGSPKVSSTTPTPLPLPPLTPNASLRWDVVSRLLPTAVGDALEVGCGRGAAAARIAERASSLVAVEPDRQSFEVARQHLHGRATVHNCMSFDLPGNDRFDTVCAFEVLEHIEDDVAALIEWRTRLKPGGTLVLSVPAWQSRYGAADEAVGHFRRYDPDYMHSQLELAGFTDIHVELYGFPAGNLLESFRNLAAARMLKRGVSEHGIAERTAGSGRLFQPSQGLSGIAARAIAMPMVLLQRIFPGRGVGLVARARAPQ